MKESVDLLILGSGSTAFAAALTTCGDDAEFLRTQLQAESIRLLLLNGQAVFAAFQTVLGGRLVREQQTVVDRSVTTQVYTGQLRDRAVA